MRTIRCVQNLNTACALMQTKREARASAPGLINRITALLLGSRRHFWLQDRPPTDAAFDPALSMAGRRPCREHIRLASVRYWAKPPRPGLSRTRSGPLIDRHRASR